MWKMRTSYSISPQPMLSFRKDSRREGGCLYIGGSHDRSELKSFGRAFFFSFVFFPYCRTLTKLEKRKEERRTNRPHPFFHI